MNTISSLLEHIKSCSIKLSELDHQINCNKLVEEVTVDNVDNIDNIDNVDNLDNLDNLDNDSNRYYRRDHALEQRNPSTTLKLPSRAHRLIVGRAVEERVTNSLLSLDKKLRCIGKNRIITYILCVNFVVDVKIGSRINRAGRKVIKNMLINGIAMLYIKEEIVKWQHDVNNRAQIKKRENRERAMNLKLQELNKERERKNVSNNKKKKTRQEDEESTKSRTSNSKKAPKKVEFSTKKTNSKNNKGNGQRKKRKVETSDNSLEQLNENALTMIRDSKYDYTPATIKKYCSVLEKNVQSIESALKNIVLPITNHLSRIQEALPSKTHLNEESTTSEQDSFEYVANNINANRDN